MADERFAELAARLRAEAAALTKISLWRNAEQTVAALPLTPSEVQIENTTSDTLLWKRGMAPWQRTKW